MLSISYSAAYDPYHTAFRFLTLLLPAASEPLDYEWLRISDFYLCFPQRLNDFRPSNKIKGMRGRINRHVKSVPDVQYASLPESAEIFTRMSIMQDTALSALCREEILSLTLSGSRRYVFLKREKVPAPLRASVDENINRKSEILEILSEDFLQIDVLGPGGLKDRSGLEEFQYDTV